jgi:hypothetical protein
MQDRYDATNKKLKSFRKRKGVIAERAAIRVGYRSPKAVIVYLGQLIALQNYAKDRFVLQLLAESGQSVTFFRVIHAREIVDSSALSVHGPRGDTYYIPHPDYGSLTRDRTLRALTIASELLNAAISEKSLPPASTIVVR